MWSVGLWTIHCCFLSLVLQVVESFLSKEVSYVISSSREARQERWAPAHSSVVTRATPAGKLPSAGPGPGRTNPLQKSMATVRFRELMIGKGCAFCVAL